MDNSLSYWTFSSSCQSISREIRTRVKRYTIFLIQIREELHKLEKKFCSLSERRTIASIYLR